MMIHKRTIPSFFDYFCFAFFIFVWIIPLLYMGFTNRIFPRMPPALSFLHNASALFAKSVSSWPQYFIEMRFQPDGPWTEYDYTDDFKMKPFGYRTRVNRFFEIFSRGEYNKMAREELARWIRGRYALKNPGKPLPIAIRFTDARVPLRSDGFDGHWKNKPLSEFSQKEKFVVSVHNF